MQASWPAGCRQLLPCSHSSPPPPSTLVTHRASDFPPKQVECRTGAELERKYVWLGGFRLEINRERRKGGAGGWHASVISFV